MNNKQIAAVILHHADKAPDTLRELDYITIHCDNFSVKAPNTRPALRQLAAKFQKPKNKPHTNGYYEARLASQGPIVRREPIGRLIKRYPDCAEAFALVQQGI